MSDLVWLYAVTAADAGPPAGAGAVTGVAGEPVRLVTGGSLSAVVGTVPAADFAEDPLKQHLEDLRWLEAAARAHHGVIESAFGAGEVVPLQFATVYHDDDAVRAVLRERAADFAGALERVRGRAEFGVKGYLDPGAVPEPAGAGGPAADAERNPGTAYLLRRKARQGERERAYRLAQEWSEQVRSELSESADRLVVHPPQDPRLAGYEGWMILNDSFLVDRHRTDAFTAAVASCAERLPAVELEVSGPWPPYSFVGGAGSDDGTGAP